MNSKNQPLHLIGKVHSSQGVRGGLFVVLFTEDPAWIDQWETLYLSEEETSSRCMEYKILKKQPHNKQGKTGFVIDAEGVDDRDKAEFLAKHFVWIPEDFISSKKGETIFLREILGFQVEDASRGVVGPIVDFSSNGPQDLLCVDYKGTVFEVPFVKAFLVRMDFAQKKIYMDIPQGLLEDL